jgi:hypothetical protein
MNTATIQHQQRREPVEWIEPPDDAEGADAKARQREVSGVGLLVLGAVIAASLRADWFAPAAPAHVFVDPGALRALSLAIAVGFLAYAIEQDRRLRALEARHAVDTATATAAPPVELDITLRLHHAQLLGDVVDALVADVRDATSAAGVELRLRGFDGVARCAGMVGERCSATRTVSVEFGGRELGLLVVHGAVHCREARIDALAALGAAALVRARDHEHTLNVLGELRDAVAARPRTVTLVG